LSRASASVVLAAAVLLLGGCSFAPPYKVPESAAAPPHYQELGQWDTAQPSDNVPKGTWWTPFDDDELNSLESRATQANQTLAAAFARLQEARADTRVARADLFPTITLQTSAMRARASTNSPQYTPGSPTQGNDFNVQGDLGYEFDLWGRVRNEIASARATQQASAADLAAVRLSIQAEVATDYFGLRSFDTQQQILDKTVDDYRKSLDLTQSLFDGGAAALSDLEQAKSQLHSAQTQQADIHLLRAQQEHAIGVLIGENPSAFQLTVRPLPLDATPPPIEAGLPSQLLERRPDVAEAERRVAAANAQIGVARAAYFPKFTLGASAGFNSVHAANWIDAPSLFWSVGPQVSLPIFEGGRLVAQTARAGAVYLEQVANYRNAVLSAFQDVEDNLAALRQLEIESNTQAQAVEASDIALQKAQDRYLAGIVTYLEVASTETTALQAQLSRTNIQTRRLDASVLLIKALGGGWNQAALPELAERRPSPP
jgi:NodT family efflux transporter outer membrane factor (OMF) lipoprotein